MSEWLKIFESSALYRHEYGRLFEDYLDLCICCFANRRLEERYLSIAKRYDRDELETMAKLMGMMIVIHEEQTAEGGWFDSLGQIYEYLASRSKASRLGQFFTPEHVCNVIAQVTLQDEPPKGYTMLDPACGSGRMLLAAHALKRDHGVVYAADVDAVCAKMCALNFWMHGIRGEVACMNSLSLEWRFALQTHPRALWPFITLLEEDRKTESLLYVHRDQVQVAAKVKPAAPDLFTAMEPEEDYGDPFRPCDLCGRTEADSCQVVEGRTVAAWEYRGPRLELLCCPACGAPLRNEESLRNPINTAA